MPGSTDVGTGIVYALLFDRVRGAPLVEPVVVGEHQPGRQPDGQPR